MKSKLTFVILLLLVFISQETVAFAKTCQMETVTSSPMLMEHMQSNDSSDTETNIDPDCCANTVVGNHCSMSGCLLLALPNFIFNQTAFMVSETVERSDSRLLSLIPGSLYRPPILA